MAQSILLRGARQVLTLHGRNGPRRGAELGDLSIIEDGSVLIRDGIIAAIGSTRRLENLRESRDATEVFAGGKIIMPPFADPGLLLCLTKEEEGSGEGKRKKTTDFYHDTLTLMRSCLQHGTLVAETKIEKFLDLPGARTALRQLCKIAFDPISTVRTLVFRPEREINFQELAGWLPQLVKHRSLHFIEVAVKEDSPAVPAQFIEQLRAVGLGFKLRWEGPISEKKARLLTAYLPRTITLCHPSTAWPTDVLVQSPGLIVLADEAGMLADFPNDRSVRELIERHAALALSSGYHEGRMRNFNMQTTIALAVRRLSLTVEEAIVATTVNSAYAAGLGHAAGTLEAGKRADLILLNISDYRELAWQYGANHVGLVFRQGLPVFNRTGGKLGLA